MLMCVCVWLKSTVIEMLLDDGEEIEAYDGTANASVQPDNVSRSIFVHWLFNSSLSTTRN